MRAPVRYLESFSWVILAMVAESPNCVGKLVRIRAL